MDILSQTGYASGIGVYQNRLLFVWNGLRNRSALKGRNASHLPHQLKRCRSLARWHIPGRASRNGEFFLAQQVANLAARVLRPRAAAVQLDVAVPMPQRFSEFALALVGQRQVVVGIGVAR